MKPKLKGNLAELYATRTYKLRSTKTFKGVEWIRKYRHYRSGDICYSVEICGVNGHGVEIAASLNPATEEHFFWQCADSEAVKDILNNPLHAYLWADVKNGIRKE